MPKVVSSAAQRSEIRSAARVVLARRGRLDPALSAATVIGVIDGLLFQYLLEPVAFEKDSLRDALRLFAHRTLAP